MAGIDSIIDRILKDARESADGRVARAEQDAEKLIAKKKDQAKEEEAKMLADAQKVIDAQAKQNQATQNTKSQRRLLSERVALIDEIVEEAKKRIRNLPSEDRLSMIRDFVIGSSEGDDGVLIVSSQDRAGITDAFLKELSSKTNSTITLSDKSGDFDVGCILICGDCEYNGTLEARADDLESDIRDAVNRVLFAKK
ncbi:MAG: V-type ATP synthase subunit E [Clostridiales bacterium]|nr:V-type ATP synthase subunit E [Clostridiales bacterium]